jgi:hypothetical protein
MCPGDFTKKVLGNAGATGTVTLGKFFSLDALNVSGLQSGRNQWGEY